MSRRNRKRASIELTGCTAAVTALLTFSSGAAEAQVAGANQGIFSDEQQLVMMSNQQIHEFEREKMQAERELEVRDAKEGPYRLYVQKTIKELTAANAKKDPDKLKLMEDWLKRDDEYRAAIQSQINNLNMQISQVRKQQQQNMSNLQNDVVAMRENVQDKKDAQKFDQMMRINYFNELQSEMGAASWGAPPTDGTFNSTGGYGMMGGYGMSAFGRQSGRYGRW